MKPGFHPSVSAAQYHADDFGDLPSLSSHIAQILLRESPRKAWYSHPRLNPNFQREEEAKFDLGTCAHAVLLEDDSSRIEVIDPALYPAKNGNIPDGWTNNSIRAARDQARAIGKTPLLKHHYQGVQRMVDVAREYLSKSEISEYWFDSEPEVTAIWQEGGLWLRARMDKITKDRRIIQDYKSTVDSSPEAFSRLLVRMGYHIQEAFYRRGAQALGIQKPEFVFVAQSVEPPYECSLHGCAPALKEIADAEVDRAIGLWRDCMVNKVWPSHSGRIHWAMPTAYQIQEHELRLMEKAA